MNKMKPESKQHYNPKDVQKYSGKTFLTSSGSKYGITLDGRFTGRPSIEGAKISMIAGVEDGSYLDIRDALDTNSSLKNKLERVIIRDGEEIRPGLRLVISLTEESSKEKGRYGFITSQIKQII